MLPGEPIINEKMLPAKYVNKGCCSHQELQHGPGALRELKMETSSMPAAKPLVTAATPPHPQGCTLKALRMEESSMLALDR